MFLDLLVNVESFVELRGEALPDEFPFDLRGVVTKG